jgi:DNA-binding FrmR family transcriptional regulator
VQLERETVTPVVNRIKRAQGQLAGVLKMLEEGRDCTDIVTQLAAASRALDKAGFALIAAGLDQALSTGDAGGLDKARLEKAFMSLA